MVAHVSRFDDNFRELMRMDAARRGVAPRSAAAPPVDLDDEGDDDEAIAADDFAALDAELNALNPARRCKRYGGPRELTPGMIEFARRLAQGEEPFAAASVPPCRYRRRAVRALLSSPLFAELFE